ncbi:hypothetical protein [Pedobacter foliorum]|uniref:hypothetical protein n=1 Tax=Pedobacter foliorum TaxID=2739058 RepID=UPI0015650C7F|nr:hypothetical protein [Pedobacter foliorum]NRF37596.1 hypothetical protein [Pedobacter foliorum]
MEYTAYLHASQKHLNTCLSLLDAIKLLNSKNKTESLIIVSPGYDAVLHNAYYLSGYTLECIINYSIFKHYKFKSSSVRTVEHNFSEKCGLTYGPETKTKDGRQSYPFYISKHQFSRNIQILTKAFPNSLIPFVDNSVKVDADLLSFFRNWDVEMRYHDVNQSYNNIRLTIDNVSRFVELTQKIFNGLMKIVG